jgi:hypothetical protein
VQETLGFTVTAKLAVVRINVPDTNLMLYVPTTVGVNVIVIYWGCDMF